MRLVIVESPYAGTTDAEINTHLEYARACLADCFERGEAPFASHLIYTQVGILDDRVADQRLRGINAGLAWGRMADLTVVYTDFGISAGMRKGIADAQARNRPIAYRQLREPLP